MSLTEKSTALEKEISSTRDAIRGKTFWEFTKLSHEDENHLLRKHFNQFPALPFTIDENDFLEIQSWSNFPFSQELLDREWTPLEKLFFAQLWKDGKLRSSGRIVEGVEQGVKQSNPKVSDAIVYHFFGRHLVDPVANPIIDQHSYRAYKLIENQHADIVQIRKIEKVPSEEEATAYCKWFCAILNAEKIVTYQDTRIIDSYLFALGKYAKMSKRIKVEG
jgi:hypothetical protein